MSNGNGTEPRIPKQSYKLNDFIQSTNNFVGSVRDLRVKQLSSLELKMLIETVIDLQILTR